MNTQGILDSIYAVLPVFEVTEEEKQMLSEVQGDKIDFYLCMRLEHRFGHEATDLRQKISDSLVKNDRRYQTLASYVSHSLFLQDIWELLASYSLRDMWIDKLIDYNS